MTRFKIEVFEEWIVLSVMGSGGYEGQSGNQGNGSQGYEG
jgi:hypothetical protein